MMNCLFNRSQFVRRNRRPVTLGVDGKKPYLPIRQNVVLDDSGAATLSATLPGPSDFPNSARPANHRTGERVARDESRKCIPFILRQNSTDLARIHRCFDHGIHSGMVRQRRTSSNGYRSRLSTSRKLSSPASRFSMICSASSSGSGRLSNEARIRHLRSLPSRVTLA